MNLYKIPNKEKCIFCYNSLHIFVISEASQKQKWTENAWKYW